MATHTLRALCQVNMDVKGRYIIDPFVYAAPLVVNDAEVFKHVS